MRIEFTIIGDPVSGKNSRQIVPRGPKSVLIKSADALDYVDAIIRQIPKSAKLDLQCDLKATVVIYYASRKKDVDAELIFDTLQTKFVKVPGAMIRSGEGEYVRGPDRKIVDRVGVYRNDRLLRIKIVDGSRIDKENPRAEICIETIAGEQGELVQEQDDDSPSEVTT